MAKTVEERKSQRRAQMAQAYKADPQKFIDRANAFRAANTNKVRGYKLKTTFGITRDDYEMMLIRQRGCCGICESWDAKTTSGVFHVDHNHQTKQVRQLLCANCNHAVGKVMDDTGIAKKLVAYLEKWSN
jgi:hypothetical protein